MRPSLVVLACKRAQPVDNIVDMAVAVRLGADICSCPTCIGQIMGELLAAAYREQNYLATVTGDPTRTFPEYAMRAVHVAKHYIEVTVLHEEAPPDPEQPHGAAQEPPLDN